MKATDKQIDNEGDSQSQNCFCLSLAIPVCFALLASSMDWSVFIGSHQIIIKKSLLDLNVETTGTGSETRDIQAQCEQTLLNHPNVIFVATVIATFETSSKCAYLWLAKW